MPPKYARLAGLGAYGVSAAFAALLALIGYASRHTAAGGMMPVLSWVTWIAITLVALALISVHVYIGNQLLHLGRGGGARDV